MRVDRYVHVCRRGKNELGPRHFLPPTQVARQACQINTAQYCSLSLLQHFHHLLDPIEVNPFISSKANNNSSLWEQRLRVSRLQHHSAYVFKLHRLSSIDIFSTLDHLLLSFPTTKPLSAFEFDLNSPLGSPPLQLPHSTSVTVLPPPQEEGSPRQSLRIIGSESIRPP